MKVLVTGAAGFLGYHISARLLEEGWRVVGVDNLNPYYDPQLKLDRIGRLERWPQFQFARLDLAERRTAESIFETDSFAFIVHLAAQAGVRYSIDHPHAYVESNLAGFLNVLEGARAGRVPHLIYASSSSVYAGSTNVPFTIEDRCDRPISLYAATKRANELMAHCYSHLFGIATTGLRFFTVYGPWGRPDMAPWRFAEAIDRGQRIDIYNYGRMQRDFTYVDDVVEGVFRLAQRPAEGYRLFNIGASSPVALMDFVHAMESAFGRRARKRFLPMQPGDVVTTHADVEEFFRATGFRPRTTVESGVERFVGWYRDWTSSRTWQAAS